MLHEILSYQSKRWGEYNEDKKEMALLDPETISNRSPRIKQLMITKGEIKKKVETLMNTLDPKQPNAKEPLVTLLKKINKIELSTKEVDDALAPVLNGKGSDYKYKQDISLLLSTLNNYISADEDGRKRLEANVAEINFHNMRQALQVNSGDDNLDRKNVMQMMSIVRTGSQDEIKKLTSALGDDFGNPMIAIKDNLTQMKQVLYQMYPEQQKLKKFTNIKSKLDYVVNSLHTRIATIVECFPPDAFQNFISINTDDFRLTQLEERKKDLNELNNCFAFFQEGIQLKDSPIRKQCEQYKAMYSRDELGPRELIADAMVWLERNIVKKQPAKPAAVPQFFPPPEAPKLREAPKLNERAAHIQGLNVHVADRDKKTEEGLQALVKSNRALGFDEDDCQEYVNVVVDLIQKSSYKNKERALEALQKKNGSFPPLLTDPRMQHNFKMSGLQAFSHICFSIILRTEKERDISIQSLIGGLTEGHGYCAQGKIQKVMVATIQGYVPGIMIDVLNKTALTINQLEQAFYADEKNRGIEGNVHLYERSTQYILNAAKEFVNNLPRDQKPGDEVLEEFYLRVKAYCEEDDRVTMSVMSPPKRV